MKSGKHIVFSAITIIVLVIFFSVNMVWSWYVSSTFDPFFDNENLLAIPRENTEIIRSRGWETHVFTDLSGSEYTYQMMLPPRLNFGGGVSILAPTYIYISEHYIGLTIFTGLRDWTYVLRLGYVTSTDTGVDIYTLGSAVDRNGQPLGRHPEDSEEFYQEWLTLHEKLYEPIMKFFGDIKEFFGEDVFR